jgi:hypothetical protein
MKLKYKVHPQQNEAYEPWQSLPPLNSQDKHGTTIVTHGSLVTYV